MLIRPQSFTVGGFIVRRDATNETWRVFLDGREVFAGTQLEAISWARDRSARSIADVNPLVGWGL